MYDLVGLGRIIRKHRKEHNLSLEQFAERCELSDRCISNIERGSSNPRISTIIKMYSVLNEDLNELMKFHSPLSSFDEDTIDNVKESLSYRKPVKVKEMIMYADNTTFPVCPRCQATFEYSYIKYCGTCGQCLSWKNYNKAKIKRVGK